MVLVVLMVLFFFFFSFLPFFLHVYGCGCGGEREAEHVTRVLCLLTVEITFSLMFSSFQKLIFAILSVSAACTG